MPPVARMPHLSWNLDMVGFVGCRLGWGESESIEEEIKRDVKMRR
jgi:hypothetical protein